jgi:FKBP-type peptidyl-prolyl cis-trans isomerase 2
MTDRAKAGDRVRVHYTGRLEDGAVFDTSEDGDPFEFTLGAGEAIAGFEEGVNGLTVGESRRVEIDPADGYGEHRETLVARLPRSSAQFPTEPEVGANFVMPLPDGQQLQVQVTEVDDEFVTIDGNHPLAGRKLIFDIELVDIKTAKTN